MRGCFIESGNGDSRLGEVGRLLWEQNRWLFLYAVGPELYVVYLASIVKRTEANIAWPENFVFTLQNWGLHILEEDLDIGSDFLESYVFPLLAPVDPFFGYFQERFSRRVVHDKYVVCVRVG